MANNVVEVQVIRDDDRYVTIKVTGVANGIGFNSNSALAGMLLRANTLFGANTSQICPLSLTDIKFSMDMAATGYIQFLWVGPANVNTSIMAFSSIGSATFDGITIQNNAN